MAVRRALARLTALLASNAMQPTYPDGLTPVAALAVLRAADTLARVTGDSLPVAQGRVLAVLAGATLTLPGGSVLYTPYDLALCGQAIEDACRVVEDEEQRVAETARVFNRPDLLA